jgi:4a-hydroxytetrahydrobiopterin dehydratase
MTTRTIAKLEPDQIQQNLQDVPEWSVSGELLQRTFSFEDFAGAMAFVNRIAVLAEKARHHPDILVRYNKVTLTLSTHDAGGLTARDFSLARSIDAQPAPAPAPGR